MSLYFKKYLQRGLPRAESRGFTLIELLVSIAITTVILGVIVFNQSTYLDASSLRNLAEELSSNISQAQAYGIAVKELVPGSSDFSASYGMSLSILEEGSDTAYLFFADRNDNQVYDDDWSCPVGGSSECIEKTDILRGNFIDSICAIRSSGSDQCNLGRVDISFIRPSTEASLTFFTNGGQLFDPSDKIGARIVFESPAGLTNSVVVYKNGQISVQ